MADETRCRPQRREWRKAYTPTSLPGMDMADDAAITCTCGAPMVERINRLTASVFLGCSRFPDCTETQKVPAFLEVQRAGGLELPGMEDVAEKPTERRYPT